ncbi:MAG: hypothetical protein J6I74_02185, partial [Schwartzia sp.]|nr:hypothetical protein [Schwartzia sp. (in: firmicutes)]
ILQRHRLVSAGRLVHHLPEHLAHLGQLVFQRVDFLLLVVKLLLFPGIYRRFLGLRSRRRRNGNCNLWYLFRVKLRRLFRRSRREGFRLDDAGFFFLGRFFRLGRPARRSRFRRTCDNGFRLEQNRFCQPDSRSFKSSPSYASSSDSEGDCTLILGWRFFAGFEGCEDAAGVRKIGSGARDANPSFSADAGNSLSRLCARANETPSSVPAVLYCESTFRG